MKHTSIENLQVSAYRIPTDFPESDGSYEWSATTIVIVQVYAGNVVSLGYSYADLATAVLIENHLKGIVLGRDAMAVGGTWQAIMHSIRNLGRPGVASMAISAVDNSLWDLKARLLDLPLVSLLGSVRDSFPIYGSGGFTSYSVNQLQEQLADWVEAGIPRVKMKVGRDRDKDPARVRAARAAIGGDAELFVDANGAWTPKQALKMSEVFSESRVSWLEEPVSSDDLSGLHLVRNNSPAGMEITAGEYGYDAFYFQKMLEAKSVDVLQADATRCGGVSGFLVVDALCQAANVPLSSHCAPAMHLHVGCAAQMIRHGEYFHDHVRIENLFFDGAIQPTDGALQPDLSRPGHGLELKYADAEIYKIYEH